MGIYKELLNLRLNQLIDRFHSPCPDGDEYAISYYQEVAQNICKYGRPGIQFLKHQLSDPNEARVASALFALGMAKISPGTAHLLSGFLRDLRAIVVAEAIDGLRYQGYRKAIGKIVPMISESSNPFVIGAALRFVSAFNRRRAVPLLLKALKHSHFVVRENACDELNELEILDAIPAIARLTDDTHPHVRQGARTAVQSLRAIKLSKMRKKGIDHKMIKYGGTLGLIKSRHEASGDLGEKDSKELILLLQNKNASQRSQAEACWWLGLRKESSAESTILKAMQSRDSAVRWEAAKALANIDSRTSCKPLIRLLRKGVSADVREAAAYSLSFMTHRVAAASLLAAFGDQKEIPAVRAQAAEGLAYLGDRSACRILVNALREPIPEIRFWAAFALGQLRDKKSLPELKRIAANDDTVVPGWWSVKKEARDAIKAIYAFG